MKENMPRPIQPEVQLTRNTASPRLDAGDIFMANGDNTERPPRVGPPGRTQRTTNRQRDQRRGQPAPQRQENQPRVNPQSAAVAKNYGESLDPRQLRDQRASAKLERLKEMLTSGNVSQNTINALREESIQALASPEQNAQARQDLLKVIEAARLGSQILDLGGSSNNPQAGGAGGGEGGGGRPPTAGGAGNEGGNGDGEEPGLSERRGRWERYRIKDRGDTDQVALELLPSIQAKLIEYEANPTNLQIRQEIVNEINGLIEKSSPPESPRFSDSLVDFAAEFKETREKILNIMIFRSYEDPTETNDYHPPESNLYAGPRLETLINAIRKAPEGEGGGEERFKHYLAMKTAAIYFHGMNKLVLQGNLEGFIRTAENINVQHFEAMTKLKGVPEVMRLYEQKYLEVLARDKRVSTDGYKEIKTEVEHLFKELNGKGLIKSEYTGNRITLENEERSKLWAMEKWEQEQAINVGRAFFNMTFRAAELIASGQVPEKEDQGYKQYGSFPQENAVRLMNWMRWIGYRFEVGGKIEEGGRGGREFYDKVMKNYEELLHEKKKHLGINKIIQFGGQRVSDIEQGAMFAISGVYSGWRMENLAFNAINIDGESLRKWLDGKVPAGEEIDGISGEGKNRNSYLDKLKKAKGVNTRSLVADFLRPVIENANVGMGVLLKNGMFDGEAAYEARKELWKQVAEKNVPLMVNYLRGLELKGEARGSITTLEDILARHGLTVNSREWKGFEEEDENGHMVRHPGLLQKLLFEQQYNVRAAMGGNLGDGTDRPSLVEGIDRPSIEGLDAVIKREIQEEGKKLAGHLADVVFPYLPFMNDVPFENLDYSGAGEDFFRRRTAGDFGAFYGAEQAFGKIMANPASLNGEKALEAFAAVTSAIESPEGPRTAHERTYPMFAAWVDIVKTKGKYSQVFLKEAMHAMQQATSTAQEWAGIDAESIDAQELVHILHEAHKMGLLDHHLIEDLRKKKKLGLLWLFFDFFKNYLAFGPAIIIGKEFVEETADDLVADK